MTSQALKLQALPDPPPPPPAAPAYVPSPPASEAVAPEGETIQVGEGHYYVQREYKGGQGATDTTPLQVRQFHGPVAMVSAALSRTVNLGNFESVRMEVGVTLPCYPEEITQAADVAMTFAGETLEREVGAVRTSMAAGQKVVA